VRGLARSGRPSSLGRAAPSAARPPIPTPRRSPGRSPTPIEEWDFSEDAEGTREGNNIEEEDGNYEEEDDSSEEDGDDDEYLMNPEPQNEHVGVDEEAMYLDNVQPKALQVVPIEKGPSYEGSTGNAMTKAMPQV